MITAENMREYVERDWESFRRMKIARWVARYRELGPEASFLQACRPTTPTTRLAREHDLREHYELCAKLGRVAHVRRD